jgi:diacylglycerol kinase family enzyme
MPSGKSPLFIVFNVGAGDSNATETHETIERACAEAGRDLIMIAVDDPSRIGELAREAVRRAKAVNGIVVAAGGDGTINTVAQAVLGSGCVFGVLPKGTFNYFSRTHGIPAATAEGMQVLLQESAQPVQVGLVNNHLFLVNASVGLYPKLLEDREAWKQQLGRSRWVAFGSALATLLRGYRNLHLSMEVHGKRQDIRTPSLFVGNNALQMEQLGFTESRAIDAGQLAGITLRPIGRLAMIWLIFQGALGKLGEADQVEKFTFKRLTVTRSRGLTSRRVKVATDGEIKWLTLPLEFCVSPEPLMLLRPAAPAPERDPV